MPPKECDLEALTKFYQAQIDAFYKYYKQLYKYNAFKELEKYFVQNQPYNPSSLFINEKDYKDKLNTWENKNNFDLAGFNPQDHIEACREASLRFLSRNRGEIEREVKEELLRIASESRQAERLKKEVIILKSELIENKYPFLDLLINQETEKEINRKIDEKQILIKRLVDYIKSVQKESEKYVSERISVLKDKHNNPEDSIYETHLSDLKISLPSSQQKDYLAEYCQRHKHYELEYYTNNSSLISKNVKNQTIDFLKEYPENDKRYQYYKSKKCQGRAELNNELEEIKNIFNSYNFHDTQEGVCSTGQMSKKARTIG